jgi:hypothetical protein
MKDVLKTPNAFKAAINGPDKTEEHFKQLGGMDGWTNSFLLEVESDPLSRVAYKSSNCCC